MLYNIYKNVDDIRFEQLKSKLSIIEPVSNKLMNQYQFQLNMRYHTDSLALDYGYNHDGIMGNIGCAYDDDAGKRDGLDMFSYYLLKARDIGDTRYGKRISLPQHYTIDEVEGNFVEIFSELIEKFFAIGIEELTETRERRKL
jgi:hypothetical protein